MAAFSAASTAASPAPPVPKEVNNGPGIDGFVTTSCIVLTGCVTNSLTLLIPSFAVSIGCATLCPSDLAPLTALSKVLLIGLFSPRFLAAAFLASLALLAASRAISASPLLALAVSAAADVPDLSAAFCAASAAFSAFFAALSAANIKFST